MRKAQVPPVREIIRMSLRFRRSALAAAALAALVLTSGCVKTRENRGYMADDALIGAIRPGVDNRASVEGTLGRPTFTGQFDQRDWYYVSRSTRQMAFARPKATQTMVLHVRFDERGNVTNVEKTGLERVARIDPMGGKTPTLGRERGFFQELFGNIGTVGAGGLSAPTGQ
jgi:outer membrane protein assembly factor BamE (lipoprotein component of BamABCDE complex)